MSKCPYCKTDYENVIFARLKDDERNDESCIGLCTRCHKWFYTYHYECKERDE